MAITTKTTYTHNGITYGLSDDCDTLFSGGNLTASELARFSWCRWEDKYMNCVAATDLNIATNQGAAVTNLLSYFQNNGGDLKTKYVDGRITGKPYAFNILMYGRNGDLCLNSSNASNYKVVTSCSDFQKIYVKVDSYSEGSNLNVQHPTARTVKRNSLTWVTEGVYNSDNNAYTDMITVWTVLVIDETTFFVTRGMAFPNRTPGLDDGSLGAAQNNIRPSNYLDLDNTPADDRWRYQYGDIITYDGSKHLLRWCKNGITNISDTTWTASDQFGCWDIDDNISVFVYGSWGSYRYTFYLRTEDAVKDEIAYTGLRWRYANGDTTHIYTPIIDADNYITGWSTDPDAESKLNDIADVTGNNITPLPPAPPGPGTDEDNDDPLSTVGAPFGTGLAHYYISTVDGAALTQISEAMSTWNIDATKKDLYRNLISCKIVKPPTAVPATPGVFEIYGVKPQYHGADITINEVTGNPDISFGPYSIDRKFNDFRDRAPYSKVEIFLPYCGWCALPSHVIGRSVSVAYYSDIIAGTVKAVVFCGTNPVAEASGVMSVDIPFAAQNVGEKVAAANIGMLAYGKAGIQTAAGIGTAIASKGKSGWGNILSGGTALIGAYNQLSQVENGNYTEICGKSGDGCALAGVDSIVIKITRPLYGGNDEAPYVPAGFAHTVGFVSMKQAKVNACSGLIVCDNVEVSGIAGATDAERAEIKRVLETGLYVNTPPE